MSGLTATIVIVGVPLSFGFGYWFLGPMFDGYKPFTRPFTAAEDRVLGKHPDRRLRWWRP